MLDFFFAVRINDHKLVAVATLGRTRFAPDELALALEEEDHMRRRNNTVSVLCGVIAAITAYSSVLGGSVGAQQEGRSDAAVQQVLHDYIGLYRRETLDQWKTLFLPGFVASYTNDDGSVTTRTLDEFYDRQRNAFTQGDVSETLHNVRVQRVGRLAHVFADFRFTSRGATRPGQLMLLMLEERGKLKIAALTFTYHLAPTEGVRNRGPQS
jgi:hypothetical protein